MADRIDMPGEWRRISMRYAWVDALGTLIGGLVVTIVTGVAVGFATDGNLAPAIAIAAIPFVLFVVLAVFAFLRVRTIGYLQRDDDLLVRRGMLYRRFVSVPYGRMQIVDITQGPIERMVGLKTLKFVTAAATSAVTIPGLPGDDAEVLRDRLVAVAESRRAGL